MTKQKLKLYGLLVMLPAMAITLAGCGKSVSQMIGEKVAQTAINSQTGGKANVDLSNNNVKVNSKEGSYEAGDNVKLPDGFPSDVYVIPGKIGSAITSASSAGFTISITTDKSVEEAAAAYQDKFKADGWKITGTMNFGESSSVVAEKDNRTASVIISKGDNNTSVVLSTGNK